MKKNLVVLAAVLTLAGRVVITPRLTNIPTAEGTYEALTHMFVGFLVLVPFYDKRQLVGPSRLLAWLGWTLGVWELVWFVAQRFSL